MGAGNERVDEKLLVNRRNVEAELDSQLGVEGGGQVGHELWCDWAAYNMHRFVLHLVDGKDCCRPRCDFTHAIITGTKSIVVPDARLDDSGHSCLVHLETIGLGDVEPLDFTEILAPVGKTRFNAF